MAEVAASDCAAPAAAPLYAGWPQRAPARRRPEGRPGPGRPSRAAIAARNEELLDRALDLFLETGFDATTIEAISSAIGMSRRTIYARYGDKETLFKAALQRAIDQWIVPVEALRAAELDSLEDTLLGVARIWAENLQRPFGWRLARIAATEAFTWPELAQHLREAMGAQTFGYVTDLLARRLFGGNREGPAQDAAAAFMILAVEGTIQLILWDGA
ncbi:MAG: TetR/AcrR family transcriptional regulator, partial [Novosphingobium sp.]